MNKDITFLLPQRLDCRSTSNLMLAMESVFNSMRNGARLCLDLMNVIYIDSAGFGFLQYAADLAQSNEFQIVLENIAPELQGNLLIANSSAVLIMESARQPLYQ